MSYWPDLVAMSVVTFWRSTFSSRVTQFTAISGFILVKSSVSFCMRIISPLLTVAIVSLVSAMAPDIKATAANAPRELVASNFMHFLRRSFEFLKTIGRRIPTSCDRLDMPSPA